MAPLVQRAFALRAAGTSYLAVVSEIGLGYSTVRHICENRVYLGEVKLRDEWFPGKHQPLFNAASRVHTPGRRRSKALLSGKVRCGLCGRVAAIQYNERGQGFHRCKHRGDGCRQPARSANGLERAVVNALRVVKGDQDLQQAIRDELTAHRRINPPAGSSVASTITVLNGKLRKLLDLYYEDKISAESFTAEERRLTTQIATLEDEAAALRVEQANREELADRFDEIAELLATLDLDEFWEEATMAERRTLVGDLVDSVCMYPDQITVQMLGAPPILVTLDEVGLRAGIRTVVSERVYGFRR